MTGTVLMVQEDARTASRVKVDFQRAVFLMEVVDNGDRARDQAHDHCVRLPERCLRAEFRLTTTTEERDALLRTQAAYAYQRALACLQRAGDRFTANDTALELPEDLEERYQERILPRLNGNIMPVATLVDSSAYGTDNEDMHRVVLQVWQDCHQTLLQEAARPAQLAERISQDKLAVLDCVE